MAQTPAGQRLAVGLVLAVNAGDADAVGLLLATMTRGELAAVAESLAEMAEDGIRGHAGGPAEAREALVTFAESIAGGG